MKAKQEPEGFADFWAVWRPHARHTDGRGLARDTFAKHVSGGAEPRDIIDGARWFFRTMKERDKEFVPLSSTWINRRAYEDMALQERAYQERIAAKKPPQWSPDPAVPPARTRFMQEWDKREPEPVNENMHDRLKAAGICV